MHERIILLISGALLLVVFITLNPNVYSQSYSKVRYENGQIKEEVIFNNGQIKIFKTFDKQGKQILNRE